MKRNPIFNFLIVVLFLLPLQIFSAEILDLTDVKKPEYRWAAGINFGLFMPLGYYTDVINTAPFIGGSLRYNPKLMNHFIIELNGGATFSDFKNNPNASYQFIPLSLNGVYDYDLTEQFNVFVGFGAGSYFLTIEGDTFNNLFAKAGAGISYRPFFNLKLSLKSDLYWLNDPTESMWALGASFGVKYIFGDPLSARDIKVETISTEKLFTALYPIYYKESVGIAKLKNTSEGHLRNIKVSIFVKDYMDQKSISNYRPKIFKKNQVMFVPLYTFFNKEIKHLHSDIYTTGILEIEYTKPNGRVFKKQETVKLKIYNKNALIWDNILKLGSFVSREDKTVFNFARKILSLPLSEKNLRYPKNLMYALQIAEGLKLYNIRYVKDPKTPYEEFSGQKAMIDYVQYPRETLVKKTGDCDDLTVLLSSLLESVGVSTAFVSVPGHIFMLAEVKGSFLKEKIITYAGKKWIPIETTLINDGFTTAWEKGYENFTKNNEREIKTAYEASSKFPPILFEDLIPLDIYFKDYEKEVQKQIDLVNAMIQGQGNLAEDLSGLSSKKLNKKGILFSKLGVYHQAEKYFKKAMEKDKNYKTPYYNLVLLYTLSRDYDKALETSKNFEKKFKSDSKMDQLRNKLAVAMGRDKGKVVKKAKEKLDFELIRAYY